MDTWHDVEYPLLRAIAEEWEAGHAQLGNGVLVEKTGLDKDVVDRSLERLLAASYIDGIDVPDASTVYVQLLRIQLTERGLRAVGQWPSEDHYESLLGLLETRIDQEPDDRAGHWLRTLRDALADAPAGVATSFLSAWLQSRLGLAS